uniref:Mitotic spindle assembly checkpoint protein MAD2A n=1 Tax=Hirondellea gigas TaxID=1518452 RepID=A0A2P2I0X2_9CRUS
MMATDTATKSIITLKGSSKLVSEFFYYGINSILYQRGIYPAENFVYKRQYGLTLLVTEDEGVNTYLKNVLAQIKDWLQKGQIQRLVLVVNSVCTKEVLERWDFNIESQLSESDNKKAQEDKDATVGEKDLKIIQNEMRDVIRQITASVTFLPLLDQQCAFDLLVYTKKDCVIPEAWDDTAPCFINNCQEVRLKSISTSVHKVQTSVAYKIE